MMARAGAAGPAPIGEPRMIAARPRLLLACLAALVAAPLAAAAEDFLQEGWYLGARGVYTQNDFDTEGVAADGFGFNLLAGYRIYKYLATDFEFEFLLPTEVDGKPGPNFDVRTFDLGWLFRLYPLSWVVEPKSPLNRVQPYLVAGPSWQWVQRDRNPGQNQDEGGFAGRLGAGFDVYVTERLALSADAKYTLSTGDVRDFRYWSIGWGFAYHFGPENGGGGGGSGDAEDEEKE